MKKEEKEVSKKSDTTVKKDTHSYKGWLNSDNFLKRAFSITGYQIVATLVTYGVVLIVALAWALVLGGAFLLFGDDKKSVSDTSEWKHTGDQHYDDDFSFDDYNDGQNYAEDDYEDYEDYDYFSTAEIRAVRELLIEQGKIDPTQTIKDAEEVNTSL